MSTIYRPLVNHLLIVDRHLSTHKISHLSAIYEPSFNQYQAHIRQSVDYLLTNISHLLAIYPPWNFTVNLLTICVTKCYQSLPSTMKLYWVPAPHPPLSGCWVHRHLLDTWQPAQLCKFRTLFLRLIAKWSKGLYISRCTYYACTHSHVFTWISKKVTQTNWNQQLTQCDYSYHQLLSYPPW